MGSRIGYCVQSNKEQSQILRSQNPLDSIEVMVKKTWETLLTKREYDWSKPETTFKMVLGKVDDGDVALRSDLDIGRCFGAFVASNYEPPFTSIEKNTWCDIYDNGLIIIDCTDYKNWIIYQADLEYNSEATEPPKTIRKKKIARMDSLGFVWLKSPKQLEKIGEGLY